MKPHLDHLSSRYPPRRNKNKRLLPSKRGRLRIANNNYAFDARNLGYRKRYAQNEIIDRNYFNQNDKYYNINNENKGAYKNDIDVSQNGKIVKYNFKKSQKKIRTAYPFRAHLVSQPIRLQTIKNEDLYSDGHHMTYAHQNSMKNEVNGNYVNNKISDQYRLKKKRNGGKDTSKKRKRTRNLRHNLRKKSKEERNMNKKNINKKRNKKQSRRKKKQIYAKNELVEHEMIQNNRHLSNQTHTTFDVRSLRRHPNRTKRVNRKKYRRNKKLNLKD